MRNHFRYAFNLFGAVEQLAGAKLCELLCVPKAIASQPATKKVGHTANRAIQCYAGIYSYSAPGTGDDLLGGSTTHDLSQAAVSFRQYTVQQPFSGFLTLKGMEFYHNFPLHSARDSAEPGQEFAIDFLDATA
jgi:hypothetical protein